MRKSIFLSIIVYILLFSLTLGIFPVWAEETEAPVEEEKPEYIDIVVAACDIAMGTRIKKDHLKTVSVLNVNLPKNVITDTADALKHYAKDDIYSEEYINSDLLSSSKISEIRPLKNIGRDLNDFLFVTDYVPVNTGKDVASLIQELIDENDGRTIYFPDGEYIIAHSLTTSSDPRDSVDIVLSDGAVIKAADKWDDEYGDYLICPGAQKKANDIRSPGSYYSIKGGTLDGNGKVNGIQHTYGREMLIRDICIRNVDVGISIPYGTNSTSSDIDIEDVTIIGTGDIGSVGIYIVANDNTFTNIRIYNMEIGIKDKGGGMYKSIYIYAPTSRDKGTYHSSIGIISGGAWISDCHVQNYATAFSLGGGNIIFDCSASWTTDICYVQTAIDLGSSLIPISGFRADFYGSEANATFVKTSSKVKAKCIDWCVFDEELIDNDTYKDLLIGPVIKAK